MSTWTKIIFLTSCGIHAMKRLYYKKTEASPSINVVVLIKCNEIMAYKNNYENLTKRLINETFMYFEMPLYSCMTRDKNCLHFPKMYPSVN